MAVNLILVNESHVMFANCFITETSVSFEIDALFEDNFLNALIIPFLEAGLKEKLPFLKWSFINLQPSSFLNDWVLSTCQSLRPLVTLVK